MKDYQGLDIEFDENWYQEKNEIKLHGTLSIFVNCGSQYAIWSQFPRNVRYVIRNIDNQDVAESIDEELSISWGGNDIYDAYSKEPCNTIVEKNFSVLLNDIYFTNPPKKIMNFELYAYYLGYKSDALCFKNVFFSPNGM